MFEAPYGGAVGSKGAKLNTYEAFLIIPILLALFVFIVSCKDIYDLLQLFIDQLKSKTYLVKNEHTLYKQQFKMAVDHASNHEGDF